jgi:hypothetical protein
MNDTLWQPPVPSSGFFRGPHLELRASRTIVLTFQFEDADDKIRTGELSFANVIHYRVTFLPALRVEMIEQSYDKLIELKRSTDLSEVTRFVRDQPAGMYHHFRICFDDGPCFDFICASFAFGVQ